MFNGRSSEGLIRRMFNGGSSEGVVRHKGQGQEECATVGVQRGLEGVKNNAQQCKFRGAW